MSIVGVIGARQMLLSSTRGLRNRNPGNIRKTSIAWKGEIEGVDDEFETFSDFEYGIRAIGRLLVSYDRQGVSTIEGIIRRYAPSVENDTDSYIASVARRSGLMANQRVLPDDRVAVVRAIIHHENGLNPFSDDFIRLSLEIA